MTHRNDHGRKTKWVTLPSPSGSSLRCAPGSTIPEDQPRLHSLCSSGGCIGQGFLQETLESQKKKSESGKVKHQSLKELSWSFSKKHLLLSAQRFLVHISSLLTPRYTPMAEHCLHSAVHTSKSCRPWYPPPLPSKLEALRFVYLSNR